MPTQPGMNIGYLGFNHTKPLWQNVHMRKAIAYAINKKAIVDNIYQGMGQVAKNPIPPTMWGYNDVIEDYGYNPEMAKKELELAGFRGGASLPEITLWSMPVARPYNPEGLKVGVVMISDLAKMGIKAWIRGMWEDLFVIFFCPIPLAQRGIVQARIRAPLSASEALPPLPTHTRRPAALRFQS